MWSDFYFHDMASSWAAAYLPVTQWKSCLSISRRRPEAPILNILLFSQPSPSSSLIIISQVVASFAVLNINYITTFIYYITVTSWKCFLDSMPKFWEKWDKLTFSYTNMYNKILMKHNGRRGKILVDTRFIHQKQLQDIALTDWYFLKNWNKVH